MRLSTIAVAVSLALGASLMTACDRGTDRSSSSSSTAPSGATTAPGSSSSSSAGGPTSTASTAPSGSGLSFPSIDLHKQDQASGGAPAPSRTRSSKSGPL